MKKNFILTIAFLVFVFPCKAFSLSYLEIIQQLGVLGKNSRFLDLASRTALGSVLLPSTLAKGWQDNWIFRNIIFDDVNSYAPSELQLILADSSIPESTLKFLREQQELNSLGEILIDNSGAIRRMVDDSGLFKFPINGPIVGGPPVEIYDSFEFLQTYERIRSTSKSRSCKVTAGICVQTDGLASFSVECNGLQFEFSTRKEMFFSASSPDGRSIKIPALRP